MKKIFIDYLITLQDKMTYIIVSLKNESIFRLQIVEKLYMSTFKFHFIIITYLDWLIN